MAASMSDSFETSAWIASVSPPIDLAAEARVAFVASGDRDRGALAGEGLRHAEADAAVAAGDQGNLVLEAHGSSLPHPPRIGAVFRHNGSSPQHIPPITFKSGRLDRIPGPLFEAKERNHAGFETGKR